jgi:hypothetical protein
MVQRLMSRFDRKGPAGIGNTPTARSATFAPAVS